MEPKHFEELSARLASVLPPGLKAMRRELEENFRAVLRANLEQWDLVSRERFDAQAEVLRRTQQKLAVLEQRLLALEQQQPLEPPAAR